MSQSAVGTIFNVQRFSLHDGPGMRDLIFLKGLPAPVRVVRQSGVTACGA